MAVSVFKIYSVGIAVENKKLSSKTLEICPIEHMGYVNGELTSDRESHADEGVDHLGNKYTSKVESSNGIMATWLPFVSNRVTAPDIRRGERVLLWRFSDNDEYYWTPMGLDDHLRRRETVIIAYSNDDDESVTEFNPDNCYYQEISTHNGLWTISTSKSNGEPFAYVAQINAKEGRVVITDDKDNSFEMNSNRSMLSLENNSGSSFTIEGADIRIIAKGKLKIQALETEIKTSKFTLSSALMMLKGVVKSMGALFNNDVNVGSTHTHAESIGIRTSPPT